MLHDLSRDLRFALRQFATRPGFTLTAIVVLALGLGANTAIFGVVNAFLLRPLPYPAPDRIVAITERVQDKSGDATMNLSPGNFLDWQKQSATIEQMSALTTGASTLSSPTNAFEPQRIQVCLCSANLLATLRVQPMLGRALRDDEDRPGAPRVALVSYGLWQKRLGGTPDAVGKSILIDGDSFSVAGVMPRDFLFPSDHVEVWAPIWQFHTPAALARHDLHYLSVIGRLRSGIPIERARAELDGIASRYQHEHPEVATGSGASVMPLHDVLVHNAHTSLLIVLGAVGCVLLIACVNVANLLLTRSSARAKELYVRAAMGAGRGAIIRQLLTESVLLAIAGGAAGIMLADVLAPVLIAHAPGAGSLVRVDEFSLDPAVFAFAFAAALITGIAVGLLPALHSARTDLAAGLRESTRSATFGRANARFRGVLMTAEVALSLVLLVAAGLLMRSFERLSQVKPGQRTDHVLTMSFTLPNAYNTPAKVSAFYREAAQRLHDVPGVDDVGLTSCPPLAGDCNTLFFYREDRPYVQGRYLAARERSIDLGFLAAAGVPLVRGRTFTPQDGIGFDRKNPRLGSILINEAMAREIYGGDDPIGKRIFFDYEVQRGKQAGLPVPRYEIVGVVGDVASSLDRKPQPTMYRPLLDGINTTPTVLLHTRVAPRLAAVPALNEIHKLEPSLAIYDVRTMEEVLGRSAANREFVTLLFGSFAALALLLAAVGLYGVLSYAVTQRRGEIGIRMALGASHRDVSLHVLVEGMKPALAGVAIGMMAAFFAARVMKSMLFEIVPLDPVTFALVPPLLLVVAALACYLPALRASRIDPTVALRSE